MLEVHLPPPGEDQLSVETLSNAGLVAHSSAAASSMQFISPDFLVFVLLFWEEERAARGPSHRDV